MLESSTDEIKHFSLCDLGFFLNLKTPTQNIIYGTGENDRVAFYDATLIALKFTFNEHEAI